MTHPVRALLAIALDHLPAAKAYRARASFRATATVETDERLNFQKAWRWVLSKAHHDHHLRGLVRPRLPYPEATQVLWEFQFDDDALLFALRFGGTVRGPINVRQWRQSVIDQL